MQVILCPICHEEVKSEYGGSKCVRGHEFPVIGGIIDLLQNSSDSRLVEEEDHWNLVAKRGRNVLVPHAYINNKIVEDCRSTYQSEIEKAWPNYHEKSISIGEIGSNYGSATNYLGNIKFRSVEYIGVDVSLNALKLGASGKRPTNWKKQYVRASVNSKTFKENSLDIIFCVGALHHFDVDRVFNWVPSSIKKGGLLILHEPSIGNPIAKVARKLVKGFHTPGEKPLIPSHIKKLAEDHDMVLTYEKGLHFINGSLQYLMGKYNVSKPVVSASYHAANCIDRVVTSPSLAYSFIQIYKKI